MKKASEEEEDGKRERKFAHAPVDKVIDQLVLLRSMHISHYFSGPC
jgi:hypothetical protein